MDKLEEEFIDSKLHALPKESRLILGMVTKDPDKPVVALDFVGITTFLVGTLHVEVNTLKEEINTLHKSIKGLQSLLADKL